VDCIGQHNVEQMWNIAALAVNNKPLTCACARDFGLDWKSMSSLVARMFGVGDPIQNEWGPRRPGDEFQRSRRLFLGAFWLRTKPFRRHWTKSAPKRRNVPDAEGKRASMDAQRAVAWRSYRTTIASAATVDLGAHQRPEMSTLSRSRNDYRSSTRFLNPRQKLRPMMKSAGTITSRYSARNQRGSRCSGSERVHRAALELTRALSCNPFDVEGLSQVFENALEIPLSDRQRAIRSMAAYVERHDVFRW